MNELVRLSTQDVSKAIPVTNSLIISEKLQDEHWKITRVIKKHLDDFETFGRVNFESCTLETNGGNQNIEIAILTEEHFLFLITLLRVKSRKEAKTEKEIKMQERNERVIKLKKELVEKFMFMKRELQARTNTRHIGIESRKELTEVIKNCVTDEGKFKSFAYSNYTRLIYKKIFGKDTKKIKEELGLTKNDNLRDYLTIEQLKLVQDLESKIASYIEFTDSTNKTDKETYEDIKNIVESNIKQFID